VFNIKIQKVLISYDVKFMNISYKPYFKDTTTTNTYQLLQDDDDADFELFPHLQTILDTEDNQTTTNLIDENDIASPSHFHPDEDIDEDTAPNYFDTIDGHKPIQQSTIGINPRIAGIIDQPSIVFVLQICKHMEYCTEIPLP
jgi:hypothetical protein